MYVRMCMYVCIYVCQIDRLARDAYDIFYRRVQMTFTIAVSAPAIYIFTA